MFGSIIYVKIAVNNTSYGYDKLYSYRVPVEWTSAVELGKRVLVPFGNGNRKRIGIILEIYEDMAVNAKIKPISAIIDEESMINAEMLKMILWLKETTFCTYFEAVKTILPSGLSFQLTQKYVLNSEASADDLSDDERQLYQFLVQSKNAKEFDNLLDIAENPQKEKVVKSLLEKGIISESDCLKRKIKDETIRMICLSDDYLNAEQPAKLSIKQKQVVDLLEQNQSASIKEICYLCNVTSTVITNLCKKNILREFDYEYIRVPDVSVTEQIADIHLTKHQQSVFDGISELISKQKPAGALLRGVTGSGKTSVFLKLIEYTLKIGKQAVMLVPEIALTPQMVQKFQNIFGETVAVIHSNLSLSQRMSEFKRVRSGQAQIVVGTRSAVFAPFDNIGLIIMDEEGERSYKSESSPRYNTRDVAKKRCAEHNAVLLMASATPSVESYFFAKNNRYSLFELTERYTDAGLPDVRIVDMNNEMDKGVTGNFSDELLDELHYNLEHHEQSILLLNRRGYHTHVSCPSCREPLVCPNCSIPLTYHRINGQLMCHYCGYSKELDSACPSCGYEHLKLTGAGTQKLENELSENFPDARILRMDTDTTYSRYAYEKNFTAFANGEYDVMVGTQMIAKGLDFPNVTLVGVMSVDKTLFAGDFRSYERTFSLITQVVGRSGRGEKPGRALLQTFVPEHYVLNLASQQDYIAFYNEEITLRKALIYPPFCDIYVVGFTSLIDSAARKCAGIFLNMLRDKINSENAAFPLRVLGPSPYSYVKMNGKYRYKIIMKCKNTFKFRQFISGILEETYHRKEFSNVSVIMDINGDIG